MSILKFKKINNLAVFQDFNWDGILRDKGNNIINFSAINIFYGRNYSGKTTLSRMVRALELGYISEKYENPQFEIVIKDQADVTISNLTAHNKKIRVFNEDFIKDNLKFISNSDENIVPFAILGGNSTLEEEIKLLSNELGNPKEGAYTGFYLERENVREKYKEIRKRHTDAVAQLDVKLTQKATNREIGIKYKPEKFGDQNYNKTKLEGDIAVILKVNFVPISNEQQERLLKLLGEKSNPVIPALSFPRLSLSDFIMEAKDSITKPISEAGKIEQLVKDSILNKWVKEGKQLHENKLHDCAFCGNEITLERWSKLEKHFDEESEKLLNSIEKLINRIDTEITLATNSLEIKNELFYVKFHSSLNRLKLIHKVVTESYLKSLSSLRDQLNTRKNDIINVKVFTEPINFSKRVLWSYEIYERLRKSSNDYTNQISKDQDDAKKTLRLREVHDFATTIQYSKEQKKINDLKIELDEKEKTGKKINEKITDLIKQIEDKKRLMNDEEKGAIKVNEYLNNYFGHNFLTLKAIEEIDSSSNKNIKFEIVRNGKKAHHLSEGECSLIAFCYFMAKLEDVNTKGVKPIIWIDDPISSLDSNHIFFIYSLINSEIVSNKEFEQLFISTHNLDFLKYLKRLPGALHKTEAQYFLIARENNKSQIKVMPKYLKNYVTEFNYLFHQIYICAHANIDDEDQHVFYYNFANNARKFLEAFLFYKYPNAIEKDDKLLRFFGDNQQAASMTDRINNEYSHLEGIFERSMTPIDVPEMKKIATFVLSKIKEKDSDQYEALLKSIDEQTLN